MATDIQKLKKQKFPRNNIIYFSYMQNLLQKRIEGEKQCIPFCFLKCCICISYIFVKKTLRPEKECSVKLTENLVRFKYLRCKFFHNSDRTKLSKIESPIPSKT